MSGRVLITGGFGNLGAWLSEYFCLNNYEVYILSKSTRKLRNIKYEVIQSDISDLDSLKKNILLEFDYCIHTASYNEFFKENYPKDALMINALGTRNLIEVLKNTKLKKFIYFSTFHVYGYHHQIINEGTQPNPINDYAITHLFAEYYLKQFYNTDNFPYITVRLTNSYGAPKYLDSTKWYLVLNDLVKSAYESKKIVIKSNGESSRDFIWMGDVCSLTEKLLFLDCENKTFNLSSQHSIKIIDIAKKVKLVYEQRYKQPIEIIVNKCDKNVYPQVRVDNQKLLSSIKFEFSDRMSEEIDNIFCLLENG